MDNPARWNITNSAQNIVSALVDPSKQFDHVFRRDWTNTFSGFSRHKPSIRTKQDNELKAKLSDYINKLECRKQIKEIETRREAGRTKEENEVEERRQIKICIPEVFLMEDFDLSNLEIFSRVISSIDKEVKPDGYNRYRPQLATRSFTKSQLKELQQNLTDHLDTVEEKLASQISNRSGDFFQVMSSVDSVMVELSLAIKSVTSLRRKCSKLNSSLLLPNMKSIHLSKTRNNAQVMLEKMKEMSKLCKVQSMIQLLLSTSDFGGALELVEKSRITLHKELRGIVCLKHIESQIVEIQTQAENFVNKFHEERKKRIESSLDIEQWKTIDDVPQDFQRLITLLVDDNISISKIFSEELQQDSNPNSRQHSRNSSDAAVVAMTNDNGQPTSQSEQQVNGFKQIPTSISMRTQQQQPVHKFNPNRVNYVKANGSTYVIVNSVINMIRIVMEYCKCALDIRSLRDEVLERLFTILQLFNSKTFHLVYSAGAIQVAGLKTITTRSLVVSQRSLNLIILLLPAISRHFSQLLPEYNRLRRFDEIKLYYEDHAAKIPERVNSIIKDVIDLQLQEWKAQPPVPSAQFRIIGEHLMRLHDNIQDALPPVELGLLFLKIDETFKDILRKHLSRLNISNDASPQYWIVKQELTFYKKGSAKLGVIKGWGNYDDIWTKLKPSDSDSNNRKHQ